MYSYKQNNWHALLVSATVLIWALDKKSLQIKLIKWPIKLSKPSHFLILCLFVLSEQ